MKRHLSGAEKRQIKKRREQAANQQKGALDKFITGPGHSDHPNLSKSEYEEQGAFISQQKELIEAETQGTEESNIDEEDEKPVNSQSGETPLEKNIEQIPLENIGTQTENISLDVRLKDIALWPEVLTNEMIDFLISNKPKNIGDITTLKSVYKHGDRIYYRSLCKDHFYRTISNGEKEERTWLIFSGTSKSVYCYPCKMFSYSKSRLTTSGFRNWKDIGITLSKHEISKDHITSMCTQYKRSSTLSRIDVQNLQIKLQKENYWKEILRRIVSTVKFLARLGIAFRGHNESADSSRKGNYLTCLEYLSEYDDFLKLHLQKFGNQGSGHTNYLSHQTCDEILQIMADSLLAHIVEEIKNAKYYSIILDSTPDVVHVDQLTFVVRYLSANGDIKERFLQFFPIERHDAEYLEKIVLSTLKNLPVNIKYCRGQSYDNAANMSGKYNGLQTRIRQHAPSATFIPCSSHSLNLVGNVAAESCSNASRYFLFVQNLFVFFSSSTFRWNVLCNKLDKGSYTLKKLSDTRWSARADATLALKCGYKNIKEALDEICNSTTEKKNVVIEAKSLLKKMNDYETAVMTVLWNKILQRINATSKSLQSIDCTVIKGASLLKSLEIFINENIRHNFSEIESEVKELTNKTFEDDRKRTSTENRKDFFVHNVLYVICDHLIAELNRRGKIYENVISNFKVFFVFTLSVEEKSNCVNNLIQMYKDDIDPRYFKDELEQFLLFLDEEDKQSINKIYKKALDMKVTFPNVEIILKILLTMPISNASGERSFSCLKRVKNYLRNAMTEKRLNNMAILYIESDLLNSLDCDEIVDIFSKQKARKKHL